MSLLAKVIGPPVVDAVGALGKVFDQLFTSDDERAQAEAVMEKIRQKPALLQAEINKIEAGHRSVFVAGWRPFIGWVCGLGFFWAFVGQPLAAWLVLLLGLDLVLPQLPTDDMMELVFALLGLGTLRTVEKLQGRTK